ncbi:hypothetical protein F4559_002516 [Saccharothrix violaceirubra]|uniref:Uncharacterized protein n=1 Tax=Saccharothrix violaceirubra TaxID=413306 RepID=A0A7W7T361_9PSEU|nr:hypothetical protein [Saccharothrix violaceirubra]
MKNETGRHRERPYGFVGCVAAEALRDKEFRDAKE